MTSVVSERVKKCLINLNITGNSHEKRDMSGVWALLKHSVLSIHINSNLHSNVFVLRIQSWQESSQPNSSPVQFTTYKHLCDLDDYLWRIPLTKHTREKNNILGAKKGGSWGDARLTQSVWTDTADKTEVYVFCESGKWQTSKTPLKTAFTVMRKKKAQISLWWMLKRNNK